MVVSLVPIVGEIYDGWTIYAQKDPITGEPLTLIGNAFTIIGLGTIAGSGKVVREIGERSLREIAERTGVHYDLVTEAAEEVIKETDLIAVTKQGKTGFDELIKKIGERVAAKNLDGIVISQKIVNDYASRGWNEELIRQVIKSPFTTRKAQNKANGNRATAYYQKDGSYVSVDDITKEVIQVSKIGDETWVPDSTIIDPYKP